MIRPTRPKIELLLIMNGWNESSTDLFNKTGVVPVGGTHQSVLQIEVDA